MTAKSLVAIFILCASLAAQGAEPNNGQQGQSVAQFESSLHYQQGRITLPGGLATLDVPAGFRYLGPDDAERVLVDAWGNPPGRKTLGMLFPATTEPLAQDSWGVVINYSADGHVSDADADAIDYSAMLRRMQKAIANTNVERQRLGYGTLDLLGWAEPPHYDASAHKLYWAKELRFNDNEETTLNYSIRILGRQGVLELNAVARMGQLELVRGEMQQVMGFTNFVPGARYGDYEAGTDRTAAYGLAALVGGAVAAKTGLLAKLVALLLGAKKLIAIAVLGLGAVFGRLLRRKKTLAA